MKAFKLLAVATILLAAQAATASDQEVGYCAAFHAAMGSKSIAMQTLHKARSMDETKHYIREFQERADRDPKGAMKRGIGACMEIGVSIPKGN